MNAEGADGDGYWYREADVEASAVMEALRSYRAAEVAMRRRTRQAMDMGENELLVLRYLVRSRSTGELVTPVVLTRYLGITSASTTALLDRLERTGHISRSPNPDDRRSILIEATVKSDAEIRHTLTDMHDRMMTVVRDMDASERRAVVRFLTSMEQAVDTIDEDVPDRG